MIRTILRRMVRRSEDRLGVPLEESHYMLEHAPNAMLAFSTVQAWTNRHRALPADAYYVAKIAAYREEDCGTCLQIAVNLARKAGVDRELVRVAAQGRVELLSPEFRELYLFAQKQANREDDDDIRERL